MLTTRRGTNPFLAREPAGVIGAVVVTVVIDGVAIEGSRPAVLRGGDVDAPLSPYVRDIADRISVDPRTGTVTIVRGERSVAVRPASATQADPVVTLAAVARALGASVDYDARFKMLTIDLEPVPLRSLVPQSGYTLPPGARVEFTPHPTPSPPVVVTGIPHPRRTPIPVERGSL